VKEGRKKDGRVVLLPLLVLGLVVVAVTAADTTVLLSGGGETAGLAALVDGVADPVDAGVATDGLVRGVDEDDLFVAAERGKKGGEKGKSVQKRRKVQEGKRRDAPRSTCRHRPG
jgi:hypothetical protein